MAECVDTGASLCRKLATPQRGRAVYSRDCREWAFYRNAKVGLIFIAFAIHSGCEYADACWRNAQVHRFNATRRSI
jgi:hypothetical protein